MNETSDKLPTEDVSIPSNTGDVSNFILSPRYNANRGKGRTTQAIGPFDGGHGGTNEPLESSDCRTSSTETSDRLPTEAQKTSDKRAGYQAFERKLDTRFKRVAADLDMCSQVRAAGTTVQAADANALRLPVSESGKALTEDPAGAYRRDYAHASRIVGLERRVQAKTAIVAEAELEYKLIHRARRKPEDLGVEDGRLKVARYARTHGTRAAAIAFCLDPSDPKSVERMQRNARNYLKELAAKEAIK